MVMRITGMASGMDIDKMVSDLMNVEKIPQTKLRQKKDLLSFQMDLYREVNTKVASLRDSLDQIRYSSNMTGMKATSSSTDVTASPVSSVSASTITVKVNQLASSAQYTTSAVSKLGFIGNSVSAATNIQAGVNDSLAVALDGTTKVITLAPNVYDPAQLQSELQIEIDKAFGSGRINVGLNGSNQLSLDPVAISTGYQPQVTVYDINGGLGNLGFTPGQSFRLNINAPLSDMASKFGNGTTLSVPGQFTVSNGTTTATIDYDSTDTIQSIMNKVNSSSTNVTMSFDAASDSFTFKSKLTGAASQISLNDTSGNFLQAINANGASVQGSDASIDITQDGGATQTITQSSNKFTYNGIAYSLNKVTTNDVTITVAGDADSIVNKIKNFVNSYNDLMDLVNRRLAEMPSRDYAPLTDDQKSSMSESDIANWNAKVKQGLLSNSDDLKNIKNSLRELLTKSVDGVSSDFNALYKIGITTVPYVVGNQQDAGKLQIDETKLRDAIAQNPTAVSNLFTNNPGLESQQGIAVTMFNRANDMLSSLIKKGGKATSMIYDDVTTDLGKQVYNLELNISDWNSKLSKKEDDYYKRFSDMEQAIQKSNAQISWLSSQMGG